MTYDYNTLCNAVKQNESKFGQFSFHFSDWLHWHHLQKLPFTIDPIEIGQLFPKIRVVEGLQKK